MNRSLTLRTLGIFIAGSCALGGCDQVVEAVQRGAEVAGGSAGAAGMGMSEDEKLGQKLNGYIGCINQTSRNVHDSADRYLQWIDLEKGITGEERTVYGLYEIRDQSACKDGIKNGNDAEPNLEELETAASAYLEALEAVELQVTDAYKYYDEKNYQDDDFAKAKEMHPTLMGAFKAFDEADLALRNVVKEQNEALHRRELVRIENEEGRKLLFHTKNVMNEAGHILEAVQEAPFEEIELSKLEEAFKLYETAVDECDTYSKEHRKETDSVIMYGGFVDSANNLKKQVKHFIRRKRDDKPWTDAENATAAEWAIRAPDGHPAKISGAFNALVDNSNHHNWTGYQPE